MGLAAVCAGRRRLPTFDACGPTGDPGVAGVLSGRAARCARGRRPARSPSAPRASLGASARSPARPRRRPRAPQPGPAAADQHRGLAPPPPTGTAARPRRRPRAPQPGPPVPPAPSTPVGSGCFVCPWVAARPLAVRAASFARRVASKPGQAPPPPTGPAAWPRGPSDALLWCACSGEEAMLWIGTVLLDSLLTYPERKNLFRLLFPIQFGGVCRPGGLLAAWQWGVLHDMKSPGSVSPACVTPM